MTAGSNILAEIPAYAAGMAELNKTGLPSEGLRRAEEVSERLTYNPRTMEGQAGLQSLTNGVMKVMDALGVDEAINYLNNTIVPNLQRTFGEEGAREIGSSVMMALPFVRKVPGIKAYKGKGYRSDGFESYDLDPSKTQSGVVYFADDKDDAFHFAEQFAIKADEATPKQLAQRSQYLSTDEWLIPEPREFDIEGKNLATVKDVKRVGKNPHRRTSVSHLEPYEVEALKAEGFDGVIGTPDRLSGTEIGLFDVSGIGMERKVPKTMMDVPSIRGVEAEQAINIARNEPHLIPSSEKGEGGFIGGPRNIKNRNDLAPMRNSLDEIIKRGADGGDWYDRYRASIDEVTGGDLKDNEWMSSLEGQYSAGVAPQSELAFALKDTNSAIAQGAPVKAARPAQQQASVRAIEQNDPSQFQLGPKTGEYARRINPASGSETTATGVNDFRHARNIGYTEVSGAAQREGLSPQAHKFMDYETALAVDRANQSNLAGRSDWKGEQIQAAPWVAQKGDDLYARQQKSYHKAAEQLIEQNGLNSSVEDVARGLAFKDANKTIGDSFDKHTAFATHEPQPYVGAQQLEGLANASPAEKLDFANDPRSRWDNAPGGRDAIYAGTRLGDTGYAVRTRPTQEMQGIYDPPSGADREFNPGFVARPLVAFDSGKVKSVPEADRSILDAAEATRAYIDVQGAGAWHKPWVGGQTGKSNSLLVSRDGPTTIEQMEELQAIGGKYGLGDVIDRGDGYTMTNFYEGAPALKRNVLNELLSDIKTVVPGSNIDRVKIDSGYLSMFEDVTPGSGQATKKLLAAFENVPAGTRQAMNDNPAIPKAAVDRIARDKELQSKYGATRSDIEAAREIIGKGPGWLDRLEKAVKSGVILPSFAAGLVLMRPMNSSDDQPAESY